MKIKQATADHYTWGQKCDGWHLVATEDLSVIQEKMPLGTSEKRHFHHKSQQFFYILEGVANFEVDGEMMVVNAREGLHILPGKHHKISNNGSGELQFLVVSQPKSHGDRINLE